MNLADRIQIWPIDRLKPYDRNAKTHSPEQIEKVAASIAEFGFNNPILVDSADGIIAGHGRLMAARRLGMADVPVIVLDHLTDAQRRAYVLADNKLAELSGWDVDLLESELQDLHAEGFDLELAGFSEDELAAFGADDLLGLSSSTPAGASTPEAANSGTADPTTTRQAPAPAAIPEGADDQQEPDDAGIPISETGDVWMLGAHRVMCGDSTNAHQVGKLMAGQKATLLHADPPYGMGKEADGVANDNLRGKALDGFQLDWWHAFRPHLTSNASAYIWGNAPDLWRLWYVAGLAETEKLELRNEIVWDKKAIAGMASPLLTQYPEASERALFIQFGNQFLGNINTEDFPESWEPLRGYLADEAQAAGIGPANIREICNCGMFSHWFTRSQFTLIPEKHYTALATAYPGRFTRPWQELKAEWDRMKGVGRDVINGKLEGVRSYFDNAHEVMRDVWEFPRVLGEERHDHATPKPVAMMARVMKSSAAPGGIVAEPFGGSGSTLIGAEVTGRACYTMEMQPVYVDTIVRRWEKVTGLQAVHEATGQTFAEVAAERAANENAGADAVAA